MDINEIRFVRKAEVRNRYGLTDPQIHRLREAGLFPAPVYFGPRSPRWRLSDLEEFDRRAAAGALATADQASALTSKARATYVEKAAAGEIGEKRRATAARKASSHEVAA